MSKSYSKSELQQIAKQLAARGIGGDTKLVHMNAREMRQLENLLGRKANINPHTGLPSFDDGGESEGASNNGHGGDNSGASAGNSGANADGSESEGASNNGHGPSAGVSAESEGASNNGHGPTSSHSLAADNGLAGMIGSALGHLGITVNENNLGSILGISTDPGQMAKAAINGLVGMVPGIGTVNSISGMLGGPTVGDIGKEAVNGHDMGIGTSGLGASQTGSQNSQGNANNSSNSENASNSANNSKADIAKTPAPKMAEVKMPEIPAPQPITTTDFLKTVDNSLLSNNPILDQIRNNTKLPDISPLPSFPIQVSSNDLASPLIHLLTNGVG